MCKKVVLTHVKSCNYSYRNVFTHNWLTSFKGSLCDNILQRSFHNMTSHLIHSYSFI